MGTLKGYILPDYEKSIVNLMRSLGDGLGWKKKKPATKGKGGKEGNLGAYGTAPQRRLPVHDCDGNPLVFDGSRTATARHDRLVRLPQRDKHDSGDSPLYRSLQQTPLL